MLLTHVRRRLAKPAPRALPGQGVLVNRANDPELSIWTPPDDWKGVLPTVVGPWKRIHEWLEEVGYRPKGVLLVSGATGFNFQQVVQSIDADGGSYTNSATETALATTVNFLGSGAGTVSGGAFRAGLAIGLHFRGILSTTLTPNWTTNVRLDSTSGTTLGAQALYATASGIASLPFGVDALIVCRADSTAGILETCVEYMPGATPGSGTNVKQLARANITSFDTTANHNFLVTGLWGTANAANTAIAKIFIVEVLN